MPVYTYFCDTCETAFERALPLVRYDESQLCADCRSPARKTVAPVNFNLPGDGWASKDGRISRQMAAKNNRLDAKQNERRQDGSGISLVPNVGGERVDNWSEASKLAASQGKDTTGYASRVPPKGSK